MSHIETDRAVEAAASVSGRRKWLPELDGLRCIAAFSVVLAHYDPLTVTGNSIPEIVRRFTLKLSLANIGVAFFYGLSAFLLTYISLSQTNGDQSFGIMRFYMRRILRIWPLYFFILVFNLVVTGPLLNTPLSGIYKVENTWSMKHVWLFWGFVSNWSLALSGLSSFVDHSFAGLSAVWSIAVEEQFYLFFPLVLVLCLRSDRRWTRYLTGGVVLGFASRVAFLVVAAALSINHRGGYLYYATSSYLDVFAAGAFTAYGVYRKPRWFEMWQTRAFHPLFGYALIAALFAIGFIWTSCLWPPYTFGTEPLGMLTDVSWTAAAARPQPSTS